MESVPIWLTPAIVALFLPLFLLLERLSPLRARVESLLRHVLRNLATGGVSLALVSLIQVPLLLAAARFAADRDLGVVRWLSLPAPWATLLSLVLLDYTLWIWHWASHRVPLLWRFHLVHHIDRDLDSSTALRFHFGELTLSIGWRALQIVLIGCTLEAVAVWQAVLFVSILFHHSSIRLPSALERRLVRLIVTPRMHAIHHDAKRENTDSNWSSILTVWDFLHRTFIFDVPDEAIRIGVPAYQSPGDTGLLRVLTLPFLRQRDDWNGS